jgi:hypothetical protein
MPCVDINIGRRSIKMTKTLDIQILFHIFENNFTAWDIILVSYLNQKLSYRKAINRSFSKLKYFGDYKKEIILDYKELNSERTLMDGDKDYFFIVTGENLVNKAIRLKSYSATFIDKRNELSKIYQFSMRQLSIIYKLTRVIKIENLMKSLIILHNNLPYLELNLECFDSIDEEFFHYFSNNHKKVGKNGTSFRQESVTKSKTIEVIVR